MHSHRKLHKWPEKVTRISMNMHSSHSNFLFMFSVYFDYIWTETLTLQKWQMQTGQMRSERELFSGKLGMMTGPMVYCYESRYLFIIHLIRKWKYWNLSGEKGGQHWSSIRGEEDFVSTTRWLWQFIHLKLIKVICIRISN